MKKILVFLSLLFLLISCNNIEKEPEKSSTGSTGSIESMSVTKIKEHFISKIYTGLQKGETLKVFSDTKGEKKSTLPDFTLDSDLSIEQLNIQQKYFTIGDIYIAFAYRKDLNYPIVNATKKPMLFSGILVSQKGFSKWHKLFEITNKDKNINNPFSLTIDNLRFNLTVIDGNGVGSGEGIVKKFVSEVFGRNWKLEKCGYYDRTGRIDWFVQKNNKFYLKQYNRKLKKNNFLEKSGCLNAEIQEPLQKK